MYCNFINSKYGMPNFNNFQIPSAREAVGLKTPKNAANKKKQAGAQGLKICISLD